MNRYIYYIYCICKMYTSIKDKTNTCHVVFILNTYSGAVKHCYRKIIRKSEHSLTMKKFILNE